MLNLQYVILTLSFFTVQVQQAIIIALIYIDAGIWISPCVK